MIPHSQSFPVFSGLFPSGGEEGGDLGGRRDGVVGGGREEEGRVARVVGYGGEGEELMVL